ncbi:MAG: hypothetical protein F7C32_02200 [Desulfurococcales archaeon]|nr:hypothetical protein [Desulfurococcales archaeon]
MTTGPEIALSAIILVSSIPLILISIRLYKALSLLGARLDPALGFLLLSLGQIAGAASIILEGRPSYTLYVATSYLEAAGFIALIEGARGGHPRSYTIIPLAIPLIGDLVAAASSLYASYRFQATARTLSAIVGFAFVLRFIGLVFAPNVLGTTLLVIGELARAGGLAALAVFYGRG